MSDDVAILIAILTPFLILGGVFLLRYVRHTYQFGIWLLLMAGLGIWNCYSSGWNSRCCLRWGTVLAPSVVMIMVLRYRYLGIEKFLRLTPEERNRQLASLPVRRRAHFLQALREHESIEKFLQLTPAEQSQRLASMRRWRRQYFLEKLEEHERYAARETHGTLPRR